MKGRSATTLPSKPCCCFSPLYNGALNEGSPGSLGSPAIGEVSVPSITGLLMKGCTWPASSRRQRLGVSVPSITGLLMKGRGCHPGRHARQVSVPSITGLLMKVDFSYSQQYTKDEFQSPL